jgi:hypothetical protein
MQLTDEHRAKISAGRRRYSERLRALEASHARMLQVMDFACTLVERYAAEGDPLARYVADELRRAQDASALAGIEAASDLPVEDGGARTSGGPSSSSHTPDAPTSDGTDRADGTPEGR